MGQHPQTPDTLFLRKNKASGVSQRKDHGDECPKDGVSVMKFWGVGDAPTTVM